MWQGGVSLCGRIFWLWMRTWIMYLCMYVPNQTKYILNTDADLRWPEVTSSVSYFNHQLVPLYQKQSSNRSYLLVSKKGLTIFFSLVKTSSMDRRFFRFASHPLTIKIGIFFRKMSLKILRVLCKYLLNCWKKCIFIKQHKQCVLKTI